MNRLRVLWFVEHLARELDVACAVKCLAESRYPVKIEIRHIYIHALEALGQKAPQVIVHPFFYFAEGALGTELYVKAWPRALHFNLAWEELFYAANARIKGPSDEFAKMHVLHHAWGAFYQHFLMAHGVPPKHIFVNGNPAYQLYKPPYSQACPSRDELAKRHGIDPDLPWVFIPENYRWAFTPDSKLQKIADSKEHMEQLTQMKEYCARSLTVLMGWCNDLASSGGLAIILRPRPATNTQLMLSFLEKAVGKAANGFYIFKDGTVREWIIASDVVMSSFSTSLIEASIAGKPIYMIEPVAMPDGLQSTWYEHVERVKTQSEFQQAGRHGLKSNNWRNLSDWAHAEMLAKGDPIRGLSDWIGKLAAGRDKTMTKLLPQGLFQRARDWMGGARFRRSENLIPVNRDTHEGDEFTQEDVEARVKTWRGLLVPDLTEACVKG